MWPIEEDNIIHTNDRTKQYQRISLLQICIFISIFSIESIEASFQSRRPLFLPSKLCDKPCYNGGSCVDGVCQCPSGWTGQQCENCHGRIRRKLSLLNKNGSITDGPNSYSASAGCIWVFENDDKNKNTLLFKLDDFFTECCWDMLYIYDGNGVYGDLLGVFSGSLSGRQILAKSGEAIIYFASDLAFNLPGFNISYQSGECLSNCNGNGKCTNGICICNDGFTGSACQHQICLPSVDDQPGPCKNQAYCKHGKCECTKHTHGDYCQELALNPVWDTVLTFEPKHFQPRASHKSVLVDNELWIQGGLMLNSDRMSTDFVVYNIPQRKFRAVKPKNIDNTPLHRYDHSIIVFERKLYMFGGVIKQNEITNEFWEFDLETLLWRQLVKHNNSASAFPMATAGHTAHLIGNEMHIIFGYNPYEGYQYAPQIFSFDNRNWRTGITDSSILGRFGHTSVVFTEPNNEQFVLIHGGYNAPINSYTYSITNELLLYDPGKQTWTILENNGVPLFRHTAVLLDGIMLIVGGNSHNESSTARKTDCYSDQIYAFDTVCKRWINVYSKEFPSLSRYGHDAFVYGGNMYIIGGFNGEMLNDILKFTPANCDNQARDEDECEKMANGVRCIFFNKTCARTLPNSSLRQSFLSIVKGDTLNALNYQQHCTSHLSERDSSSELRTSCASITDCTNCLIEKGCGWCESNQMCLGSYTSCADGLLTDRSYCPYSSKQRRKEKKLRPCNLATNCFACHRLPHCTWFAIDAKHICVSLADQALLIEEHNRIQAERITSMAITDEPLHTTALTTTQSSLPLTSSQDVIILPIADQSQQNATCPVPCFLRSNCQTCIEAQCMWCPSTKRCVSMDTYMISFPYGQCMSWVTAANTNYACQMNPFACERQKTCSDCQSIGPRCGWCDDGSGTGLGKCIEGTASEPSNNDACSIERWFFTGEPECQCNGHSNCTENATHQRSRCTKCQNRTRGEHCETCETGYYGDPRNGGLCQECQCNGQATLCNQLNGDCYCSTKGVIGPKCDKCEPKYIGDPKNGGTCTYELSIDFIFTFKLDSDDIRDKYVNQINFYSVPYKRDTDVQFSITCEGDSGAKVTINLTTQLVEGRPLHIKHLMAGQLCTGTGIKRTYSASDPGFTFGTETNTTFHVRVSDFITPIKIQISFAQSLPINWILFFVIFAACFIVLLVVAGLIWIIKMRIEWYRNIRRRHDEIEEMASRPFASVQLDLANDPQNSQVGPCAVEPCANYQAGVYTVIVRLPTGGQHYTPYGTSGLAVASALCQLTPAQLALIQPPDMEKRRSRKSNFRRFMPFIRS